MLLGSKHLCQINPVLLAGGDAETATRGPERRPSPSLSSLLSSLSLLLLLMHSSAVPGREVMSPATNFSTTSCASPLLG